MSSAARLHGGNAPPGVLDFSAPANPLGTPSPAVGAIRDCVESVARYPDPSYPRLRALASKLHGVNAEMVVPVNGAAEAYTLALAALKPRTVLVLEPSFGDHVLLEKAGVVDLVRLTVDLDAGNALVDVDAVVQAAQRAPKPVVVVLSRPNNPVGYLLSKRALEDLHSRLPRGVYLIVDEAFIDLCIDPRSERLGGWITVRSFTKSLAMPGLRLGYIASEDLNIVKLLDAVRQPWPVSSLAECVCGRLVDAVSELYVILSAARKLVVAEAARLYGSFRRMGLTVYSGCAPYLLLHHTGHRHPKLQERLVRHGVYVRDASSFYGLGPYYSRVSIRLPRENDVLVEAFRAVIEG